MTEEKKVQFADLEPVGPGTPSGTYLRRFWHPVYRVKDLPVGRPKPIEVLGERFTLYRGEDGKPRLVDFRCPHRGTQLSLGWIEGNDIRCRYHGWKFDANGQCIEQPNEDRPFCQRVKMRSYPVREYLELIFAYLGEGEPPELQKLPDFEVPGVIIADPVEVLPCNFWNRLDNDLSHIAWVHRATAQRTGRHDYMILRREDVVETSYGWCSTRYTRSNLDGMKDMSKTSHFIMPTINQFGHRTRAKGFENRNLWDTKITWTVPVNDQKFAAFDVTLTPIEGEEARIYAENRAKYQEEEAQSRWDLAEKVLAGEMTLEEIPADIGAYTSFEIEDYTTQVGQGPVRGRNREHLGRSDERMVVLRRKWLEEVNAMLNEKPTKKWQLPAEPFQVNF
jgi:5,5'-dehydrodivanillate O-demethylase